MTRILFAALFAVMTMPAGAWTLDSKVSAISYVTMKNAETAEANLLTGLTGQVDDSGKAMVEIPLTNVETYVDIRNERMREFVFKVAEFPVATLNTQLDMDALADLVPGETAETTFEVMIAANGAETSYEAMAFVTRVGENRVMVASKQPVILYVQDLGYEEGIAKLQELAELDSIQLTVPVSFLLAFTK